MPQTTPEISDPRAVATTSNASSDPSIDPLLKLHKMSTTAGVGSTDYVAVNGTSIVAIGVRAMEGVTTGAGCGADTC